MRSDFFLNTLVYSCPTNKQYLCCAVVVGCQSRVKSMNRSGSTSIHSVRRSAIKTFINRWDHWPHELKLGSPILLMAAYGER